MKESEEDKKTFHKLYQPVWLFFLVCLNDLLSNVLSILFLIVEPRHFTTVYLIFIIVSCLRIPIWLFNSIYLIGLSRPLLRMYFLLDNNLLYVLGSTITYLAYNFYGPVI